MTARQEILAAMRSAFDTLAASGTDAGYQQTGVEHDRDFTKFEGRNGRGKYVYCWLGPESILEDGDASAVPTMQLTLMAWGKLNLDAAIIEDSLELMIADMKRALILLDETNFPEYSGQTTIRNVSPDVINRSEAYAVVEARIYYTEYAG